MHEENEKKCYVDFLQKRNPQNGLITGRHYPSVSMFHLKKLSADLDKVSDLKFSLR
jgi:hypothetical protein